MKSNKRAFVFILLNTSIHLWRNSSHWKGERKQKPKAPENIFSAISGTEVPRPWGVFLIPKRRHLLFPNFSGSHFGFAGLWPCAISRPGLACTLSSRRDGPWPSLSRPERRAGGRGGGRHSGRGSGVCRVCTASGPWTEKAGSLHWRQVRCLWSGVATHCQSSETSVRQGCCYWWMIPVW